MKKTVLIATGDPQLNNLLENNSDFYAVYTLTDVSQLFLGTQFFHPDTVVVTDRLGDESELTTELRKIKKEPDIKKVQILFLTPEIKLTDYARINEFGPLIELGIYPVFTDRLDLKLINSNINTPPTLGGRVSDVLQQYQKMTAASTPQAVQLQVEPAPLKTKYDNIILFSSKKPGSGKTFIAVNYAAGLAKYGQSNTGESLKVGIIEGDLHNYSLGKSLGFTEDSEHNLINAGKVAQSLLDADIKKATARTKILQSFKACARLENLQALVLVSEDDSVVNSMTADQYSVILDVAAQAFDVVVIDTNSDFRQQINTKNLLQLATHIYYILTMDNNSITDNLKLVRDLKMMNLTQKVEYLLNEYHADEYDRALGVQPVKPLMFDKNLLLNYGFDLCAIIPYIDTNILWNQLFKGSPLLLESDGDIAYLYPKIQFLELINQRFPIPALNSLKEQWHNLVP